MISKYQLVQSAAALVMAAVTCAACGGSTQRATSASTPSGGGSASRASSAAGGSGRASVLAAAKDPCILVTRAQAQAILGGTVETPRPMSVVTFNVCSYHPAGTVINVVVAVEPFPLSTRAEAAAGVTTPAGAVGHRAVCGGSGLVFTLLAAIDAQRYLEIAGPSCAADEQFAMKAYAEL